MELTNLIKTTDIIKIKGWIKDINIEDITIKSSSVKKNNLFIAIKGEHFDGHNFLEEAIIKGATALVLEKEMPEYNIPQIIVKNTRKAYATICSEFFGNPKDKLKFIGITGTNGKTSCALFISQILNSANKKCATIGTLGAFCGDKVYASNLTTPDPYDFHKLLKEFIDDNVEYVSMEVSAHAIFHNKIFNIDFEVGILTNITQDHLDFFKTMKNYANTKLNFFKNNKIKYKIINSDDKYSLELIKNEKNLILYGLHNPADIFAINISTSQNGTIFTLNAMDNIFYCTTNLSGEFNVYNLLAVVSACLCVGVNFETIINTIKNLHTPTGRFNVIHLENNRTVIIDFAHTPDGLSKALSTARSVCKGKLISLFGCGGDRDKLKRPIMGKIAEELSDFVILTSDNPRFEKPENILHDIELGIKGHNYLKLPDRKIAIQTALEMLEENDIAVICGKGGELYQDINGIKIPYDDFEEVKKSAKIFEENYKGNIC